MKTRVDIDLSNHILDKNKFGYSALLKFCNEKEIVPISAYNLFKPFVEGKKYYAPHGNICRESMITIVCPLCESMHEKMFRCMITKNVYCHDCSVKNGVILHKKTCLEKFGVDNARKNESIKEKGRQTCLRKYNVDHPQKCKELNAIRCATDKEKNNGVYFVQTDNFKQLSRTKNQKNRQCDFPSQCPVVQTKIRASFRKRCGYDYYILSPEFQERCKHIFMEKYGVEHPMHNQRIVSKCLQNSYRTKEFISSSGRIYQYQGYEHFMLDKLIKDGIDENDLVNDSKLVPFIPWFDSNGKIHKHTVDMFIKTQNKCIEVKSEWTIKRQGESNVRAKQNGAKLLGYLYEVWIFDDKGRVRNIWY